jgi:hypothetical protein
MALHRLTLERDAQLRQSALLHAHQVDSARMAFEQERNKVEDEARNSKKLVREKLLAAVEDRRRRLREDKEGGEGMTGESPEIRKITKREFQSTWLPLALVPAPSFPGNLSSY